MGVDFIIVELLGLTYLRVKCLKRENVKKFVRTKLLTFKEYIHKYARQCKKLLFL